MGFALPKDRAGHSIKDGDSVTIEIENIDSFTGNVNWVQANGLAISLDMSGKEEENLIAQLMSVGRKIPLEC